MIKKCLDIFCQMCQRKIVELCEQYWKAKVRKNDIMLKHYQSQHCAPISLIVKNEYKDGLRTVAFDLRSLIIKTDQNAQPLKL